MLRSKSDVKFLVLKKPPTLPIVEVNMKALTWACRGGSTACREGL